MAGLVRLCLKAAPGYISSRSFHPPSTSSNHRISLNTLFHIAPSSPSLSHSRRVPWPWLRFPPTRNSQRLFSPSLRISTTLQLSSSLIPPSLSFTPRHRLRSPLLRSTLEVYPLLAALHISTTPLQLDSSHDR